MREKGQETTRHPLPSVAPFPTLLESLEQEGVRHIQKTTCEWVQRRGPSEMVMNIAARSGKEGTVKMELTFSMSCSYPGWAEENMDVSSELHTVGSPPPPPHSGELGLSW